MSVDIVKSASHSVVVDGRTRDGSRSTETFNGASIGWDCSLDAIKRGSELGAAGSDDLLTRGSRPSSINVKPGSICASVSAGTLASLPQCKYPTAILCVLLLHPVLHLALETRHPSCVTFVAVLSRCRAYGHYLIMSSYAKEQAYVAEDHELQDGHNSHIIEARYAGTEGDIADMKVLGRTQETRRIFTFISMLGFGSTLMVTWEVILANLLAVITNGGTVRIHTR